MISWFVFFLLFPNTLFRQTKDFCPSEVHDVRPHSDDKFVREIRAGDCELGDNVHWYLAGPMVTEQKIRHVNMWPERDRCHSTLTARWVGSFIVWVMKNYSRFVVPVSKSVYMLYNNNYFSWYLIFVKIFCLSKV